MLYKYVYMDLWNALKLEYILMRMQDDYSKGIDSIFKSFYGKKFIYAHAFFYYEKLLLIVIYILVRSFHIV